MGEGSNQTSIRKGALVGANEIRRGRSWSDSLSYQTVFNYKGNYDDAKNEKFT